MPLHHHIRFLGTHRKKVSPRVVQTLAVLVTVLFVTSASAADWAGKMVDKDGTTHVMNPAAAATDLAILSPKRDWKIGGETDDEDQFFAMITDVAIDDDGNVYLLDHQLKEVCIFSKDGEFIRRIGREGEGPGEFRNPLRVFVFPDGNVGVLQAMPGKIVMLTPDGAPAGDYPLPKSDDGSRSMLFGAAQTKHGLVLATHDMAFTDGGMKLTEGLKQIDNHGKLLGTYYEHSETQSGGMVMIDSENMLQWSASRDGQVYLNSDRDHYKISVHNPDGSVARVIEREYEPLKRSSEDIREMEAEQLEMPEQMRSKVREYTRPISEIYPRDDGTLWVLSSRGTHEVPDGTFATFDVFDGEGRFMQQVRLDIEHDYSHDAIYFVKDQLFVVTDLRGMEITIGGPGGGHGSTEDDDVDEEANPMSVVCYGLGFKLVN